MDEVVSQHINSHLVRLTDKRALIVTLPDLIKTYRYDQNNKGVLTVDPTYILENESIYDCVIIDYTTNYIRESLEIEIYNQLAQSNIKKPWVIITADVEYYGKEHPGILYYPIYLIDGIDKGSNTEIDIEQLRTHNLCFLTYHYHWHRLVILTELYKTFRFESCLINLPRFDQLTHSQRQSLENSKRFVNNETMISDMWKMAPIVADVSDLQEEIVDLNNRAFSDSYINVFSESDYDNVFATEKCVKPFLSGQFYAVFANPKIYIHLKELGFDLLDDYYTVTNGETYQQKVESLISNINHNKKNLSQQWKESYTRRAHNYKLSRSPWLRNKLTIKLRNWLNK